MHLASRLRRPIAFIFAVLLLAVGSASPVQAASKKERRYYEYTSTVMRIVAKDVAAEINFDLTAGHLKVIENASQDPWMFSTSNKICKTMIAAKTSAQRKRVSREVVGALSDLAGEELQALEDRGLPDDEAFFWGSVVGAQYVTVITGAQNVLCTGQGRHIKPMVDAYLSAAEKMAGFR